MNHPVPDPIHETGGVFIFGWWQCIDRGRAAIQLDRFIPISTWKQKLLSRKGAHHPPCGKATAVNALLGMKPIQGPIKSQVVRNHLRWRNPGNRIGKLDFHADNTANSIEEHLRKSLSGHYAELCRNTDLDTFVSLAFNVSAQLANVDASCPTLAASNTVPTDAVPDEFRRTASRIQFRSCSVAEFMSLDRVSSGMDSISDWMISATNSERPLTPAFA